MINKNINIEAIKKVSKALDDLNKKVVYVGGVVVGLYADDFAADDPRATKDVDFTLEIASYPELIKLEEELAKKGFTRDPLETIECRFFLDKIMVDVMSTTGVGWAPANKWFKPGFDHIEEYNLEGTVIKIFKLPFYLATKLEAFNGRGKGDPYLSQDFEDIVYLLDNRTNIVKEILSSPNDVKTYLQEELKKVLTDDSLQDALAGHLYPEISEERREIINTKLDEIIH